MYSGVGSPFQKRMRPRGHCSFVRMCLLLIGVMGTSGVFLNVSFMYSQPTASVATLNQRGHTYKVSVATIHLPQYPLIHRENNIAADANISITSKTTAAAKKNELSKEAIDMCHRTLWHTLETTTFVLPNDETFVITGDIQDLWLRDSAAQIHPLLIPNILNGKSLVQLDPKLERIVAGLIRISARYIRHDPYANAFRIDDKKEYDQFEREQLGRHGYVATRNYELDSACYFMRMLYFFHHSFPSHPVLLEPSVREAVEIMIDLWIAEQRHEDDAFPVGPLFDCKLCGRPYRYNPQELPRGKGTKTNPDAGLTWSGFRPSDDPQQYGYLIPSNMFAVVALQYMEALATDVWNNSLLASKAGSLRRSIDEGIQQYGIVNHPVYGRMYAYEVDGYSNSLLMDDANVPNLMSLPYLGYPYDPDIYENTKKFILSKHNPTFHTGTNRYTGPIRGYGSPHTRSIPNDIWPMSIAMQALVSNDARDKVALVEQLVNATAGTGWMHESFDANNPERFSRPWFCWPDSLYAELVMSLTSDCPSPTHRHKYTIKEWRDKYNIRMLLQTGSVFDGSSNSKNNRSNGLVQNVPMAWQAR